MRGLCLNAARQQLARSHAERETTMVAAESKNKPSERLGRPGDPCVMVIFGASGDLTKRKLIPALLNLARAGLLPEEFAVVGLSRRDLTHEAFRQKLGRDLKEYAGGSFDPGLWDSLPPRLYY